MKNRFCSIRTASNLLGVPYNALRSMRLNGSLPGFATEGSKPRFYVNIEALALQLGYNLPENAATACRAPAERAE